MGRLGEAGGSASEGRGANRSDLRGSRMLRSLAQLQPDPRPRSSAPFSPRPPGGWRSGLGAPGSRASLQLVARGLSPSPEPALAPAGPAWHCGGAPAPGGFCLARSLVLTCLCLNFGEAAQGARGLSWLSSASACCVPSCGRKAKKNPRCVHHPSDGGIKESSCWEEPFKKNPSRSPSRPDRPGPVIKPHPLDASRDSALPWAAPSVLDHPLPEEILPDVHPEPPLAQPEAVTSCPTTWHPRKETATLLSGGCGEG